MIIAEKLNLIYQNQVEIIKKETNYSSKIRQIGALIMSLGDRAINAVAKIVVDQKEPSKFESINGKTVNKSVEHKPIIGDCAKKTEKIHQQKQKLNEMKQQILNAEQNKKYEQELIDNCEEQEEDFGMSM